MTYLISAILGVVQGVAEFLPISSSGHLSLLQYYFGLEEADNLLNVLLHFATLLAVMVVYRQDIIEMIIEFFNIIKISLSKYPPEETEFPTARRLVILIIVGTLPLFVVLPAASLVESFGSNPVFVSCALLVTGTVLFIADRMPKGKKNARTVPIKEVVLVGVAQGFATIPGFSRSGFTIAAALALGFERNFAVRFSFLLSLPAVLGATILKVLDTAQSGFDQGLMPMYLVGMVLAFFVGLGSISLVKLLAQKGKFGVFSYYCWVVGGISLLALLLK
ncbi:MAG: undecaprenyl-diphosphate phosphatase [Eubacteriales bacterium]